MQAAEPGHAGRPAARGQAAGASATGLLEDAGALTRELRGLVHDQLQLAVLEARLAARTMTVLVALGVGLALLLAAAWLGLLGAAVMVLINQGLGAAPALLIVALLNLAVTPLLYALLRRQVRSLGLPATLRTLKPQPAGSGIGGAA